MLNFHLERSRGSRLISKLLTLIVAVALLGAAGQASADPCKVTPTGGTVELPPNGCEYLSPDEVHEIIAGLPPGTTIKLAPIHRDFMCHQEGAAKAPCSMRTIVASFMQACSASCRLERPSSSRRALSVCPSRLACSGSTWCRCSV